MGYGGEKNIKSLNLNPSNASTRKCVTFHYLCRIILMTKISCRMKSKVFFFCLIILFAGSCRDKKSVTSGNMPVPEILVANPIQKDIIYTYEYPAYLEAVQTVNLVARVSGFLDKMEYVAGQPVKTGKLLFVIEPQPYRDQFNAAQAQMKSSEARLTYAKAQYERMKEAMPSRAISEIDFIQAESDYHAAIANVQSAKAQLNSAKTNLDYCYIKAPFDGRVSRNLVDIKNFVNGSMQPVTLATMYRDQLMYAYFNMAYAEYQTLPPVGNPKLSRDSGMMLTITDASTPTRQWPGQLDYSSPNVDLQTGTVAIRAIIKNPKEELLSGMYVKIKVPYKKVDCALLIPETSIGTAQTGRYVYLVNDEDKINQQIVKVGILEPDGMREIISGVSPDDRYVVEALMTVRPGMTVKPIRKE